jgi:glyoxylase-like metal-dependent hydrolase (beta-lactamase superfamily II)
MLRRSFLRTLAYAPAGGLVLPALLRAQSTLQVTSLADKLHVLMGAGGNIAILEGEDGLLLIDSGLPTSTDGILAETGKIGKGKITRLINTHFHFDHVGGNVAMGKGGAKIIAHENVKKRLSTKQFNAFLNRTSDPLAPEGIPGETFKDRGTLKHGGETLEYHYLQPAHTDGDTVIHFANANVLHAGDLVFNGTYPFIDYSAGGSLAGMASDASHIAKNLDSTTKIIPGHGPIASKNEVAAYADMLVHSLDIMAKQIDDGKTLEQVLAAKPFAAYDEKWGGGFVKPDIWITMNYKGMAQKPA